MTDSKTDVLIRRMSGRIRQLQQALKPFADAVETSKVGTSTVVTPVTDRIAYLRARDAEILDSSDPSDPITDYWLESYSNGHCTLCGNRGTIDTRGVSTPAGAKVGRLNYCLCLHAVQGRGLRDALPPLRERRGRETMTKNPHDELLGAIEADAAKPKATDKLDVIRDAVRALIDLQLVLEDHKARGQEINDQINALVGSRIPDLMSEAGLKDLSVESRGNSPAAKVKLKTFYNANIAAKWTAEKRAEAFAYLEEIDAGDLIKTEVSIRFPREKRAAAIKLVKGLEKKLSKSKAVVEVVESVNGQTLSAWLREMTKANKEVKLDLIGGHIGRIANVKIEGKS